MSSEFSPQAKPRRVPVQRPRQPSPTAQRHTTPQSLRDLAYEAIKFRIITCAFKPGEYVNEARISTVLGLGRTPVHQAIDRLMLEGMVQVIPRKGVIVKPVSLDEVMQIIEARFIVEPQGIRLTAERADENDIAGLTDILARAQQWRGGEDHGDQQAIGRRAGEPGMRPRQGWSQATKGCVAIDPSKDWGSKALQAYPQPPLQL